MYVCKNHSTETALLSVIDNLLFRSDNKLVSVVSFLDLSAAFDTIDHDILLDRLRTTFGIHQTALNWFSSYLSDRQISVKINSAVSKTVSLQFGVPQGSVLGPILFTLYTQPLSNFIHRHLFDYHKYADDTELQKAALLSDFDKLVTDTESCVADVKEWMNKNKLKLNEDKTELLAVSDTTLSDQRREMHVLVLHLFHFKHQPNI